MTIPSEFQFASDPIHPQTPTPGSHGALAELRVDLEDPGRQHRGARAGSVADDDDRSSDDDRNSDGRDDRNSDGDGNSDGRDDRNSDDRNSDGDGDGDESDDREDSDDDDSDDRRDPRRAAFMEDLPDAEELRPLIQSYVEGNYARLRERERALRSQTSDSEVLAAARELVERTEPDPLAKTLLAISVGFFLLIVAWVYFHHGQ